MLIKATDDKTKDIDALKLLSARPDASADTRKKVEQEIRNIQSGITGEAEAAWRAMLSPDTGYKHTSFPGDCHAPLRSKSGLTFGGCSSGKV